MGKVLIDIGHPAHVHLFRNVAALWRQQGHSILFSVLDREMILELMRHYELPFAVTCRRRPGKTALFAELIARAIHTLAIARKFKPDLFISMGNPTVGIPAFLTGKPYIALTDTEHATEQHLLFKPFATVIATPSVFRRDLGPRQIRYDGYHELAYLHPDRFQPDPEALKAINLRPNESFFIVRFVGWGASHDIGQSGFAPQEKVQLLRNLSERGRVLLSVEGKVDREFADFVTPFPSHLVHHLLAFATMYIGEGGTMASEAAVLGTPSIFVNSLELGYLDDLEQTYGLLFQFRKGAGVIEKVLSLLEMPDLKQEWQRRRQKMLSDKIDTTAWLFELGNRYLR